VGVLVFGWPFLSTLLRLLLKKKELYERRFTAKSNATTFSIEYIPLTTNRVDQPHKKEEEEEQTPRTSRGKAMTTWSSPRAMVNAASTRTASSSFKSWKSRATTKTTTMTATRRRSVGTTNDDDRRLDCRHRHRHRTRASADGNAANNMSDVAALDGLINQLLNAHGESDDMLQKVCIENIMAFDQQMWLRMASRIDNVNTDEEKDAITDVMSKCMKIIEATLKKAEETIDRSSEQLQRIISAAADQTTMEFDVPLKADALKRMEAEVKNCTVDEGMLNTAYAWIRKSDEDKLDGMVHILQKFLQLYAARELNKNKAPLDELLGCSNTDDWPVVFQKLVNEGYGEVAFTKELQQRMEEVVLGLTNGSYAQRVQAEYLKEVEERSREYFKQV